MRHCCCPNTFWLHCRDRGSGFPQRRWRSFVPMWTGIMGHYWQALFSVCGELTAFLDCVSEGRGFSFMQSTRRSASTSSIPYLWVSVQTHNTEVIDANEAMFDILGWDSLPSLTASIRLHSPSSLHWYESTRQLSSHFAWRSENLSFTLLRLKSSLKRVSLFRMERESYQLGRDGPWFSAW